MQIDELQKYHLDLLKKFITRYEFDGEIQNFEPITQNGLKSKIITFINRKFQGKLQIVRPISPTDPEMRFLGRDWPITAESMIGMVRMNQLHDALDLVRMKNIPGDIVETGIWRGGAVIFISAYLSIYGQSNRTVYGCDSFQGLPQPEEKYPADQGDLHSTIDYLAVPMEIVEENFKKYNINTENIRLIRGWFEDTLPILPVEEIAILRLDGDMYSSTIVALESLFPKVSEGGVVIIDDYSLHGARKALYDYFSLHNLDYQITDIDGTGAYFIK